MAWGPPSYQRVHDVSLSNENLEALLKRCSLDPAILQEKPSKKLLYYVHRQFFLELPFENLSVLRENWISLDVNDIINKICGPPRRGGYCFELNKLLASILQHLGFHVQPLASRVFLDDGQTPRLPTPPVQTHMCLLVAPELGGETFLCDVAFGKVGLLEPLSLNMLNKGAVKNGHARMKLISSTRRQMSGIDYEIYTLWYTSTDTETDWIRGYAFLPVQDCHLLDFIPLNGSVHGYFESPFTHRLWCETRSPSHVRIFGTEWVMNDGEKSTIESGRHLQQLLQSHFRLDLSLEECRNLYGLAQAPEPSEKWSRLLALRRRAARLQAPALSALWHWMSLMAVPTVALALCWRLRARTT